MSGYVPPFDQHADEWWTLQAILNNTMLYLQPCKTEDACA